MHVCLCAQEKLRGADTSKLQMEADNQVLREAVSEKKVEAERESRRKERMEKEMKELRASLEARQQEIKAKQQQVRGDDDDSSYLVMVHLV